MLHFDCPPPNYEPGSDFLLCGARAGYQRVIRKNEKHGNGLRGHATVDFAQSIVDCGVTLACGRPNLDFNSQGSTAFYTSKYLRQVIQYVLSAKVGTAGVVQFQLVWPKLELLQLKCFAQQEYDSWAAMVVDARLGQCHHNFDLVEGPFLANPGCIQWYKSNGLSFMEAKKLYGNDLPEEAMPKASGHQLAFCTERSVDVLNSFPRELTWVAR
eukprot:TRINITY_DN10187_c1_g1_i2.p1 TRINITY_DN10187_c1_g1~~TRINITY_DN10187_c1_g1_i2.p1  ORF type:complete len:222 (+),score=29.27 TRINITY_DN10187_c1_g1_i2:28-666(+)